ncbi:MAG: hypothetical protein ACK5HL_01550 [Bacilli bacterium]
MNYIYDFVLNYKKNAFEFYEWNTNDEIINIKKMPFFKINTKVLNDLKFSFIKVSDEFLEVIENKTELFDKNKLSFTSLFSDGIEAISIKFDKHGLSNKKSKLLLDEEFEVLEMCSEVSFYNLKFEIIKKGNDLLKPRYEIDICNYLIDELENVYEKKLTEKLKYIYLEFTNEKNDNIKYIYEFLKEKFDNKFTKKHEQLYNILHGVNNK